MSDSHLANAIAMVERKQPVRASLVLGFLREEQKRRARLAPVRPGRRRIVLE